MGNKYFMLTVRWDDIEADLTIPLEEAISSLS